MVRFIKERTPRRASRRRRHADLLGGLVEGTRLRRRDARSAARLRPLSGQDVRTGPLHRVRTRSRLLGARTCRSTSARTTFNACASNIIANGRSPSRPSRPARSTSTRNTLRASGRTATISPRSKDGRVKKEAVHNGAPTGSQGWYFNTRREQFKDPRIREALGLAFDFEWTNKNVMFSSYKRVVSYFQNSAMEAVGAPGAEELAAARAASRRDSPIRVRRALHAAGQRRLGQRPRAAQARQRDAARGGLHARRRRSAAAERQALHDRVPRFLRHLPTACRAVPAEPARSSASTPIRASSTPRNTRAAPRASTIDVVASAFGGSVTPGAELRVFLSSASATMDGSRNLAGVADPAVDALVEKIVHATTRAELNATCRALDRVLRAGALLGADVVQRLRSGSPIGTRSRGPSASRNSAPARPTPGGGTKRRRRKLACERVAQARRVATACRFSRRPFATRDPRCAIIDRSPAAPLTHARLYRPPHSPDDPDDLRHHAGLLRHRAIRAGRAGRARDRAIAGQRPGLDRAHRRRRRPDRRRARWRTRAATSPRAIAARRGSIRNSSRSWRSNTASTSRRRERFWMLVRDYSTFNLGKSYYRDAPVIELIKEKLPVSMSLGLWMTLISYAISIPLGISKAVKDGSRFDTWTSALVIFGYADPELPFRHPAGRAVLRRLVLADLSRCAASPRTISPTFPGRERSSTISGTSRCR